MAFRARKVSGAFEKQAPDQIRPADSQSDSGIWMKNILKTTKILTSLEILLLFVQS